MYYASLMAMLASILGTWLVLLPVACVVSFNNIIVSSTMSDDHCTSKNIVDSVSHGRARHDQNRSCMWPKFQGTADGLACLNIDTHGSINCLAMGVPTSQRLPLSVVVNVDVLSMAQPLRLMACHKKKAFLKVRISRSARVGGRRDQCGPWTMVRDRPGDGWPCISTARHCTELWPVCSLRQLGSPWHEGIGMLSGESQKAHNTKLCVTVTVAMRASHAN